MTERVTDLNYLERQLHEVEDRLQQAVGLLTNLKTVQGKFKDLATYYQDTKAHIDEAKRTLAQMELDHAGAVTLLDEELTRVIDAQETFGQAHLKQVAKHDEAHKKGLAKHAKTISDVQTSYHDAQRGFEQQFHEVREAAQQQMADLVGQLNEQLQQLTEQRTRLDADVQGAVQQAGERVGAMQHELKEAFEAQRHSLNAEYVGFTGGMREELSQSVENMRFTLRETRAEVGKQVTELRTAVDARHSTLSIKLDAADQRLDTAVAEMVKRTDRSEEKVLGRLTPVSTELGQLTRKHEALRAELTDSQQVVSGLQARQKSMNTLLMLMAVVAVVALILSIIR